MQRESPLKSSLLVGFGLSACLAASCQGNGITSVCPSLPLYETTALGDAAAPDASTAGAAAVEAQLARAVDAGCATAPSVFPSLGGDGGVGGNAAVPESDGNSGAGGSSAGGAGHD